MYLPEHFAEHRPEVLHRAVHAHPLGLLVTPDAGGPGERLGVAANEVPFLLDAGAADGPHGTLRAHVARANPLWQAADGREVLVVFQGPHTYVSPSWYPSKAESGRVVPTWNFVMVQARGRLRAVQDRPWLHHFVTRLTDRFEADRTPPWAVADAPADYVEGMLGAIVGIEITLDALVGKWKVSQNRSAADRDGVARALELEGSDGARASAQQVREPGSN